MTEFQTGQHDEEFKAALALAFDSAWESFLEIEGESADTQENRRRLAGKIVQLAQSGETDQEVLSQIGLIHLRVLVAGARLGERSRAEGMFMDGTGGDQVPGLVPLQWGDHTAQAFGPETVAVMAIALDRCLQAMPLHLPSDARRLLSSSILEQASRGERDPERLELYALDALKARQ